MTDVERLLLQTDKIMAVLYMEATAKIKELDPQDETSFGLLQALFS